ncbi:MAG: M1 family aminopeptidase [Nitrospirota bacterium]|nr:M1 family aminopeptidase [Nitrospirota bacterium]
MTHFAVPLTLILITLVSACAGTPAPPPAAPTVPRADVIHHEITVRPDPLSGRLAVRDKLTLPARVARPGEGVTFSLARGLEITAAVPGVERQDTEGTLTTAVYKGWPQSLRTMHMEYSGVYPGTPGEEGVTPGFALLSGSGAWYPQFFDADGHPEPVTFTLTALLPPDWNAVSQGAGPLPPAPDFTPPEGELFAVRWQTDRPQDEIYLVAGPFTKYEQPGNPATAQAFLLTPDPSLADRYLTAATEYMALYSALIAPYPYEKFALVENVAETGWGMPSFTLLGRTVIRLPFIAHTSFPHEIVHNWWGNGVQVDYAQGNWAEGLTRYLADHLLAEGDGRGAAYRRDALQKYADFVAVDPARDFPLEQFTTREDEATQAVGYGKGMMLFHMLRVQLGDEDFKRALTRFYEGWRFRRASWENLRHSVEQTTGRPLKAIFIQWLTRTGAPELALAGAEAIPPDATTKPGHGDQLRLTLRQTHAGAPYTLYVPVGITVEHDPDVVTRLVRIDRAEQTVVLDLPSRPLHVAVDPWFDLFRTLSTTEVPAALSGLFGSEAPLFVLPSADGPEALAGWRMLGEAWSARYGGEIVQDDALDALPAGRAVWLLGARNRFVEKAARMLIPEGVLVTDGGVLTDAGTWDFGRYSLAFAVRDTARDGAPLGWLTAETPQAMAGLARKLPHYGKYGMLAFSGPEPTNVMKQAWATRESPLARGVTQVDGEVWQGDPARQPERPWLAAREPR